MKRGSAHQRRADRDNTETLLRSTLDALSAHIAVLDSGGTIVAVNEARKSFAGAAGISGSGVGMNYLSVCERSANSSPDAAQTAQALRDIIAGRRAEYRMEYPCESPDGLRWFQLRVTRPSTAPSSRIFELWRPISWPSICPR
jgi:two-component system, NarL family, sensor kinase